MRYKSMSPSTRSGGPDLATVTPGSRPKAKQQVRSRRGVRDFLATLPILFLIPALILPFAATSAASAGTLIASSAELAALPTSGAAWTSLKSTADGDLGTPNLTDQNNKHDVKTFAVALVADRLGSDVYRTKARNAIMGAIGTEQVGAGNSILALGRQLGAYVLAADLIGLSGTDDATFRAWLSAIRTRDLGGHSRYRTLKGTCEDSPHNWGTFACASLTAANLYLGDAVAIQRSWDVFRGFTGDRAAYSGFQDLSSDVWACPGVAFTPLNSGCPADSVRFGAGVKDVTRGTPPPVASGPGLSYTLEILQGLAFQAELLERSGHPGAWSRLRPAFDWARRNGVMDLSSVGYHVTWWANARLGWNLPTRPAGYGRVFGFTDWLYGSRTTPPTTPTTPPTTPPTTTPTTTPTAKPTAAPTTTPTAVPTAAPTTTPTITPTTTPTAKPTAAKPPTTPTTAPSVDRGLTGIGGADVAVVDSTSAANPTSIQLTIGRPAKIAAGDLLVAAIDVRGKPVISAPSGWQRLRLDTNGTLMEMATYIKVVDGNEPADYTWRFSNAQAASGVVVAVRGAAADSIADVVGQVNVKASSIVAPPVAAGRAGNLVLAFFGAARSTSLSASGWMADLVQATSSAGTYKATLAVAAATASGGVAITGQSAAGAGSSTSIAQVVVIRP